MYMLNLMSLIVKTYVGERQSNINIADGKKSAVILASEAAKMDQVNRALGLLLFDISVPGENIIN